LSKVRARGIDEVGTHIQRARRQAIAHAAEQPIINPDSYSVVRDLEGWRNERGNFNPRPKAANLARTNSANFKFRD
jgi:hypothetical protein